MKEARRILRASAVSDLADKILAAQKLINLSTDKEMRAYYEKRLIELNYQMRLLNI